MIRGLPIVALTVAVLGAACGSFEDPTIVLDLRVLAMRADLPDQVVDVDMTRPEMPPALLAQLHTTEVCALIADPAYARDLRWSMTVCLLDDVGRCDVTVPTIELGTGVISDPDTTNGPQQACASIEPGDPQVGQRLLAILNAAVKANPVQALGGVDYAVVLTIGPLDDHASDVVASKHLRVSPRIPLARTANTNPGFDYVDAALASGRPIVLPVDQRCGNFSNTGLATPPDVRPGERLTLFPVEASGAREMYVVPTLDGMTAELQETLSYQWLSTYGGWSDEVTGGGHDVLGNQSLLGSDWIAPSEINGPLLVSLWMIQRDERYGVRWFETCVMVRP